MIGSVGTRSGRGRFNRAATNVIDKKLFTGVETGFEFLDIPQHFSSLELQLFGRVGVVTTTNPYFRFNNDSGGNYDLQQLSSNSTTRTGGNTLGQTQTGNNAVASIMGFPGTSYPAGQAGSGTLRIHGYSMTGLHKTFCMESGKWPNSTSTFDQWLVINSGGWRGLAPITSIQCLALTSGGVWLAGSYAVLRGII